MSADRHPWLTQWKRIEGATNNDALDRSYAGKKEDKKKHCPEWDGYDYSKMIPGQDYSRHHCDTNGSRGGENQGSTTTTLASIHSSIPPIIDQSPPAKKRRELLHPPRKVDQQSLDRLQFLKPGLLGLLPILFLTILLLAHLLGAVGRLAGIPRGSTHNIVARVAIGLRPLVVGLARLGRLEGRSRGIAGGGWLDGCGGLC